MAREEASKIGRGLLKEKNNAKLFAFHLVKSLRQMFTKNCYVLGRYCASFLGYSDKQKQHGLCLALLGVTVRSGRTHLKKVLLSVR